MRPSPARSSTEPPFNVPAWGFGVTDAPPYRPSPRIRRLRRARLEDQLFIAGMVLLLAAMIFARVLA